MRLSCFHKAAFYALFGGMFSRIQKQKVATPSGLIPRPLDIYPKGAGAIQPVIAFTAG